MVCPASSLTKTTQQINGAGLLHVGSGCGVHSIDFALPALDLVLDEKPLSIFQPPLPVMPMLAGWETLVVEIMPSMSVPLLTESQSLPLDLDVLACQLLPIYHPTPFLPLPSHFPWWCWAFFGAAFPLAITVTGLILYYRWCPMTAAASSPDDSSSWTRMVVRPDRSRGRVLLGGEVCGARGRLIVYVRQLNERMRRMKERTMNRKSYVQNDSDESGEESSAEEKPNRQ